MGAIWPGRWQWMQCCRRTGQTSREKVGAGLVLGVSVTPRVQKSHAPAANPRRRDTAPLEAELYMQTPQAPVVCVCTPPGSFSRRHYEDNWPIAVGENVREQGQKRDTRPGFPPKDWCWEWDLNREITPSA